MSVFNLQMRVCSSINLSVLLENTPFCIMHSRSDIEWSGLSEVHFSSKLPKYSNCNAVKNIALYLMYCGVMLLLLCI